MANPHAIPIVLLEVDRSQLQGWVRRRKTGYRFRLPVIRVRPSRRQTKLNRLSEIQGPPHLRLETAAPSLPAPKSRHRAPAKGCITCRMNHEAGS